MNSTEIIQLLQQQQGPALAAAVADGLHPHVVVPADRLMAVATVLRTDWRLRFDLLRCISAIDWPAKNTIELSYDLLATARGHSFAVKVLLDRANPRVESLRGIWPAAEWHEREAFDLMGVTFLHHPDLRRILLPEDWVGHPLRKDYQYPTEYQGLQLNP
ncbi:MAG: NADH-quinone oxidoreductase subunit C [Planctomycetes bacterium]|jgi:NADH-quinone oxidoreductase subunit C|nr:NADH-quinone oxidoreductase subunit C [Planctomycetota bacterium]